DDAFGNLVDLLAARQLLDRTLLVLTSDHGESLGEHVDIGNHTSCLNDEVLRIPLLVKFPKGRFAGAVVGQQVRSLDILPTVLEVLNLAPLPQAEGRSLLPLLTGKERGDRVAISQMDVGGPRLPTAIRTRD